MDHDEAVAALVAAKAKCSDACAEEVVHQPHRADLEAAYAAYAAAGKALAEEDDARRRAAGLPPSDEPPGLVTVTTNGAK
jgi:hypothetical protein